MRKEKEQKEFLCKYIGHMLIDGNTKENRKRIKRFIALQENNNNADYEIHFLDGLPSDVCLYANCLDDIDVADTYGITYFEKIYVYIRNGLHWTQPGIEQFIEDVRADLRFDGLHAELQYQHKGQLLEIDFKVK
jgi:hypothetical protein